jgi:hypothetical protein
MIAVIRRRLEGRSQYDGRHNPFEAKIGQLSLPVTNKGSASEGSSGFIY